MAKKLQRKIRPKPQPGVGTELKLPALKRAGGRRVTKKALAEFTSQLAVLLDAGIPVTRCLRILEGQMPPGVLQRALGEVVEDVEGGTSLSESFTKHPRIFDSLYTNMVRAGEAGGAQEEILDRLAGFMEKSEAVKARVKGAMTYPIAVVLVALGVLVLVFLFVIPRFKDIFTQQFGGLEELPVATQVIIGIGEHLQNWWWLYLVLIVSGYTLHRVLLARAARYRWMRDGTVLRLPVMGTMLSKSLVARFTRTFGTLIQSGVPHLAALDIVRDSLGNVRMSDAVNSVHSSIREGAGIAAPMGESEMFDDLVVNMVDVGEQTGELDRMLAKVADRYEIEVDRSIDTSIRLLEIGIILVLAVFVGFTVYALFAPIIKLMQSIGT